MNTMNGTKQTFDRALFVFCRQGDEDALIERTGLIIYRGEIKYSRLDCLVLLDEDAERDELAREYFPTLANCSLPNAERWPKEWSKRLVAKADSTAHLEIISSEQVELSVPFLSASSIDVRQGTEGPKADPYSFDEWTLRRGADTWLIHVGLAEWVKRNGEMFIPPAGAEIEDALKAAGCPLTLNQIKRYHRRIQAVPLKLHKAHGGARSEDGMPGETLLICKCGAVLDSSFDISAII